MPKVSLNKKSEKKKNFSKWVQIKMVENNVTQKQMGQLIGVNQSNFSRKMHKYNFTLDDIIIIFNFFKKVPAEEIKDLFYY